MADGETVYELEGRWAPDTPGVVETDDAISAQWWFNLNDEPKDEPIGTPSNEPVENVTLTLEATNAEFEGIPEPCLTDGVDPASSVSDDGSTLVCNVGTQDKGTALQFKSGMRVTGASGDDVAVNGSIDDVVKSLNPLTIQNEFMMDIALEENTGIHQFPAPREGDDGRLVEFNWTLFHGAHSPDGPDSITYTIRMENSHNVGHDHRGCEAFSVGTAAGHPWSGGDYDSDQMTNFPGTCELTWSGTDQIFNLTISGLDYSHENAPTQDSRGNLLPTDRIAVASGVFRFHVRTDAGSGAVTATVDPVTYTSPVDDSTYTDDAHNNTSTLNWLSGAQNGGWTNPGQWADTIRLAPGDTRKSTVHFNYRNYSAAPHEDGGFCTILDGKYVDFVGYEFIDLNYSNAAIDPSTYTIQYLTGDNQYLNPDSATYDPNKSRACQNDDDATTWTESIPNDLTTVKAVRVLYQTTDLPHADSRPALRVGQKVKEEVDNGQEVWVWSDYRRPGNGSWDGSHEGSGVDRSRSENAEDLPDHGTATPGARYPFAANHRDVLRIVTARPTITKSADPVVTLPGGTVEYTLDYSADTARESDPIDGYTIVDTLPEGAEYVTGSASPEPVVTIADGAQVLTWTLNDVPVNEEQTLTYEVKFADDVAPGQRLVNTATADIGGNTSAPTTAAVTVNDSGSTQITKTTHEPTVGLSAGGSADAAWTVSVISNDPVAQQFVDVIDVLPRVGDQRGTTFTGSYELTEIDAPAGSTVYYTTVDPSILSDDPGQTIHGEPGSIEGNQVGWTEEFTPDATAVRVIGGALPPGDTFAFDIHVTTDGFEPGDKMLNRAQGRAENTRLVMRTSSPVDFAVSDPSHTKTLTSAEPIGEGRWRVEYDLTVTNTGEYSTWYTLTDELRFAEATNVVSAEVTNAPEGVTLADPAWDGETNLTIAEDVDLLGNADADYTEHVYELTVVVEVPLGLETGAGESECGAEGSMDPRALTNTSTLTDPVGDTEDDWACAPLPSFEVDKTIAEEPAEGPDNEWTITYELRAQNTGSVDHEYSLTDQLRFGDSLEILSAQVTDAPDDVEVLDTWTGQGPDGEPENLLVEGETLPAGGEHVYQITVTFTFDRATLDIGDLECPAPGSGESGGLANATSLEHNDLTNGDDVCATIEPNGMIIWQKTDRSGSDLEGSEWQLTGPSGEVIDIADCVENDDDACGGPDLDAQGGHFRVDGLAWGTWTLVETKAPVNYMLDSTEHTFEIGADELVIDIGPIENRPVPSIPLPLTGGTSQQAFLILGGIFLGGTGLTLGLRGLRSKRQVML